MGGQEPFDPKFIGQPRVHRILQRLIRTDRMPHALLFAGPEGTGKAAAAVALIRALQCENNTDGACGNCRGCSKTGTLNHPDVSFLFPLSSRVSVDDERKILIQMIQDPYTSPLPEPAVSHSLERIRGLQRQFAYGVFEGRWRTAAVFHADRMRPEAANALLKTLEEPPSQSLILLTAPSLDSLLPTVVSRCQVLKFPPLAERDVEPVLLNEGMGSDKARFIARACGGNLRRAREIASGEVEDVQDRAFRFLEAMAHGEDPKTYAALEQLAADRQSAFEILRGAEVWLRDVLLFSEGRSEHVSNPGQIQEIGRLASVFDLEQLSEIAENIQEIRELSKRNVNLLLSLISLWRLIRRDKLTSEQLPVPASVVSA